MIEIGIKPLSWYRKFAVQNAIFICFLTVTVSWMEVRFHFFGHLNPDILRQTLVQRIRNLLSRDAGVGIKYRYVSKGVYACICTTGVEIVDEDDVAVDMQALAKEKSRMMMQKKKG